MGTGSQEFPMTLVSVDHIKDVEDLVPPIPIPPPHWSLEDRLGPEVGLQDRLDLHYQNWLAHGGDLDGTESDQDIYWSRVLEQQGCPVPEYPAPPSYCSFSPSTQTSGITSHLRCLIGVNLKT